MNCPDCNAPLDVNARFCTRCGRPIAQAQAHNAIANALPRSADEPPTLPLAHSQNPPSPQAMWGPSQPQAQPERYPQQAVPARAPELNTLASAGSLPPQARKRRGGCLARGLLTLFILVLLVGAGWFFGLRPYLHAMAQNKIDQTFSLAVQQMPPQLSQAPAGPVPFTEDIFNNLIQLTMPPNSSLKQVVAHITASEVRVDYSVYGMPGDFTAVPQVVNDRLQVRNVHVDGLVGLIMSNDEMAATLNRHIADAQNRLNRSIQAVQLEDQKMILTLGPAGSPLPPLP